MTTLVVLVLGAAAWRNPLLLRLAWRNVPRRPGFAVLITLGLTIGTVILSSAFTTGDTMSQSVRTVVAGVLGSADEVVFIPAAEQRSGFDLAQSIASGSLLTRCPYRCRSRSSCSLARPRCWVPTRSEEHTSELQSPCNLVCRLL